MTLPLDNIKVLDFTHLLPGELCSTVLADLGCQVTRIESLKPGLGQRIPPIVKGESLYYWSLHRNKMRTAMDLKNEKAIEIVYKLCSEVDVVLENFRPGVMDRLGIGYKELSRRNPKLIYCSISGYGQDSKFAQRPGHDLNFQAETGVLTQTTDTSGRPLVSGFLVSDYTAAMYAALSITAALHERERSGNGRHLDVSMYESALSVMNILATGLLYTGREPAQGTQSYRDQLANYNVYECKDGRYLAVAALEPNFWQIFCQKIERPDLASPIPAGPNLKLKAELAAIIATRPLAEWTAVFADADCCVSPVHTLAEALEYLPTHERKAVAHLNHPDLERIPQLLTPVPFAHKDRSENLPVTDLATGTEALLRNLNFSDADIQAMQKQGMIPDPSRERRLPAGC